MKRQVQQTAELSAGFSDGKALPIYENCVVSAKQFEGGRSRSSVDTHAIFMLKTESGESSGNYRSADLFVVPSTGEGFVGGNGLRYAGLALLPSELAMPSLTANWEP